MRYEYVPNIWPLILSAIVTLFLGTYAFYARRKAKGAISFILSMLVLSIWSVANALEMCGADLPTKVFWANMQYVAYCYSPITLFVLCAEFSGIDNRQDEKKRILWLAILPTIILLFVWTNHLHGLVRYDVHLDYSGAFPIIAKKYGPVFFVHSLYSYFLNFSAFALLIRAVFFKRTVFRKQVLSLLFGLSLILVPNVVYVLRIIPSYRFDITPVFFGPAGLITALGIFRYRLFDAVPIAWAAVVKNMDSGLLVLDMQDRVLDINPAFEKIINRKADEITAKQVGEACADIPLLADACIDKSIEKVEFFVNSADTTRIYEASFSQIYRKRGEAIGRTVIANDITEKTQRQRDLLEQQWKLAVGEERERMARDLHDNLGQIMGFINMQAQGIRQELKNQGIDTVSESIDKLVDVTQLAHSDLREYIRSIRNHASVGADLVTALNMIIHHFKEQTGLHVKLDVSGDDACGEIETNVRINILNIVKEALNNIAKHAEAKNVRIVLKLSTDKIYTLIEDDGKGFDTLASSRANGENKTEFGLDIMKERAAEVGGRLSIDSIPGTGTWVILQIPA
jgi:PAS domain S-box-containing protein